MAVVLLWVGAAFALVSLVYFAFFREAVRKYHSINAKGDTYYPIIGTLWGLIKNEAYQCDHWLAVSLKSGHTWKGFTPGLGPDVYTCEPRNVEYILKTNFPNYPKAPIVNETLRDLLGEGIFAVNGAQWKFQRQMASHMFKKRLMRNMIDVFNHHGDIVLGHLEDHAQRNKPIDIKQLFYRFTLDSIGAIAFGETIGSLDKLDSEVPFAVSFDYAQAAMEKRFRNPFWKWLKDKKFEDCKKIMDDFTARIIERKKMSHEKGNDLLASFMEQTDEQGHPLSDRFLQDIVMNFMIAGRDTTGQSLCWMFYELAKHPEVEEKLLDEIERVVGGRRPTLEMMKELTYCKAVIDETLRLYPPVPSDPKMAMSDDVLPDGTYVPAGTIVGWSAYVMGHHPDLWDEPLKYDPERWLDERAKKQQPYQHVPFQAGPRICLGMNMAYLELRAMVSMLLPRYRLRLVEGQDIGYAYTITLPPKGPIMMHATKRYDDEEQSFRAM